MQRVYVMAGYLATEATWLFFSQRWRQALAKAGLNAFHMTDCDSGYGEFKGRSSNEREDLQRQFIEIINTSELVGSVGGIQLQDYNLLKSSIKKQRSIRAGLPISGSLEDPYFLSFQLLIEVTTKNALQVGIPVDQPIGFVFDRHAQSGRAEQVYSSLRGSKTLDFVNRLDDSIRFMPHHNCEPLQAADILAYESFRYVNDCLLNNKTTRWQWNEVRKKVPGWHIVDRTGLEKLFPIET